MTPPSDRLCRPGCCSSGPMEGPGTRDAPRELAMLLPALPVDKRKRGSRFPDRCYPATGVQRGVSTAWTLFSPPACRSRMFSRNPSSTLVFSRAP